LKAEEVAYVVAPYEADAQLCFLEREGFVDGIITEDSDLLVFGCRQVRFWVLADIDSALNVVAFRSSSSWMGMEIAYRYIGIS
jgi:5'-3' exonuclease